MGRKAIALFCALNLALSWAVQIVLINTIGIEADASSLVLVGLMWSPTLIALGFILFNRAARQGVAWKFGKLGYWPLGILYATAIAFACVGLFLSQGWAASGWFAFSDVGVDITGGPWLLGKGAQAWPLFVANVLLTAGAFAGMNLVAAAGEEFAWRGFLQGHMIKAFGVSGGVVLLGLFWSFWHLPLLLMGYNHPDNPILGSFVLSPIELVAVSFFYAWLTIRSGSFWPAALAHGAGNSIQEGVVSHLQLAVPTLYSSLFQTAAAVAVGLVCWASLAAGRRRRSSLAGEAYA